MAFSSVILLQKITLIDLQILNKSYIPRIKLTSSWCIIPFPYCCIHFVNILEYIFHLCAWEIMDYNFLVIPLIWHQDNTGLIVWGELESVLGIPKATFRCDDSLEGLTGLRKLLYSWLQFITVKGYRFKSTKETYMGWSLGETKLRFSGVLS